MRRHHFVDDGLGTVAVAQRFDQQQHQLRQTVALDRGIGRAGERDQTFEQIVGCGCDRGMGVGSGIRWGVRVRGRGWAQG